MMNKADRLFRALGAPCAVCGMTIPETVLRNYETRPNKSMRLMHDHAVANYWNIRYGYAFIHRSEHIAIEADNE